MHTKGNPDVVVFKAGRHVSVADGECSRVAQPWHVVSLPQRVHRGRVHQGLHGPDILSSLSRESLVESAPGLQGPAASSSSLPESPVESATVATRPWRVIAGLAGGADGECTGF